MTSYDETHRSPAVACASGPGEVEPAISPDETKLAYIRRCNRDPVGVWGELVQRERGVDGASVVDPGGSSSEAPQWPDWLGENLLGYTKAENEGDQGSQDGRSTLWYADGAGNRMAWLGPEGQLAQDVSFGDPNAHPSPSYRPDAGLRIATFGGRGGDKVPRVTNIFGSEEEFFDLDFGGEADECHHPAWNISGDRILCHRNESEERIGRGQSLRMLYLFAYDSLAGGWSSPTFRPSRLFEPRTPEELEGEFSNFPAGQCRDYFYKYAEWCGTDDHVLTTVYCKDAGGVVVSSRVFLIDTSSTPPACFDVTAAVEEHERVPDAERGTWRGVFGTCGPVHVDRQWTPVAG